MFSDYSGLLALVGEVEATPGDIWHVFRGELGCERGRSQGGCVGHLSSYADPLVGLVGGAGLGESYSKDALLHARFDVLWLK